eukprot:GEZU01026078.1.p1 GENE.GEZU01026078.1~~GEZU01026078.1.p1  ORF type:complete len:563 (+),score=72.96 GEZU01026078.1:174-1862(+)
MVKEHRLKPVGIFVCGFLFVFTTVLGTGFLGLPVKVYNSGFSPFVTTFLVGLIMQCFLIVYMIELLQLTQAIQNQKKKQQQQELMLQLNQIQLIEEASSAYPPDNSGNTISNSCYVPPVLSSNDNNYNNSEANIVDEQISIVTPPYANDENTVIQPHGIEVTVAAVHNNKFLSEGPDLHTMGRIFLGRFGQIIFNIAVVIHFTSFIISYSLAGPQALGSLFRVDFRYFVPPFVIILSIIVIFGGRIIISIISGVTLLKGTLLFFIVCLVAFLGMVIHDGSNDNWRYVGEPFLMGTVALGGAINSLPVIYSRMAPTRRNLRVLRAASISALVICGAVTASWVLFILMVVPQDSADPNEPTLRQAAEKGQISTMPLAEVLRQRYPKYLWLTYVIQIFIVISVTASFVTLGSALKHLLDGYSRSIIEFLNTPGTWANRVFKPTPGRRATIFALLCQFGLYCICFVSLLIVALLSPKGFLKILEVFTSFGMNLNTGVLAALMFWKATVAKSSSVYAKIKIPLPVSKVFVHATVYLVIAYFLFACGYNIVLTAWELVLYFMNLAKKN